MTVNFVEEYLNDEFNKVKISQTVSQREAATLKTKWNVSRRIAAP